MMTGLPTLSQIRAWNVEHLIEAADYWTATADRWDDVYGRVWQQSLGMDWRGRAHDALVERTTADRAKVTPKSDQLREAAQIARRGAGDISAVQRSVLYKVDDAHRAGFIVGEDLLGSDTRRSGNAAELAARRAQAQAFSIDIRSRAGQLVAIDTEVATNLSGVAGDVGALIFDEKPIIVDGQPYHVRADTQKGTIQLVGHGFKQDGPTPAPVPPPQPPAIKLPPRTTMNTSPPTAMGPSDDPLKHHCGPEEIAKQTTIATGGAAGIASGIAGEVPTLTGSTAIVLGGIGALWDAIDNLSKCER
jgi:hypothetical protein